jgi:hypothetical protein
VRKENERKKKEKKREGKKAHERTTHNPRNDDEPSFPSPAATATATDHINPARSDNQLIKFIDNITQPRRARAGQATEASGNGRRGWLFFFKTTELGPFQDPGSKPEEANWTN